MKYVVVLSFIFLVACETPSTDKSTASPVNPNPTQPQAPVSSITLFVYGDQLALPYVNALASRTGYQVIDKTIHNGTLSMNYTNLMHDNWGPDDIVFLSPGVMEGLNCPTCTTTGTMWTNYRTDLHAVVNRLISLNQKTIMASPLQSCKAWLHTGDVGIYTALDEYHAVLDTTPSIPANFLMPILTVNPGYVPTSATTETDCLTPTSASDQSIATIIQGVL